MTEGLGRGALQASPSGLQPESRTRVSCPAGAGGLDVSQPAGGSGRLYRNPCSVVTFDRRDRMTEYCSPVYWAGVTHGGQEVTGLPAHGDIACYIVHMRPGTRGELLSCVPSPPCVVREMLMAEHRGLIRSALQWQTGRQCRLRIMCGHVDHLFLPDTAGTVTSEMAEKPLPGMWTCPHQQCRSAACISRGGRMAAHTASAPIKNRTNKIFPPR